MKSNQQCECCAAKGFCKLQMKKCNLNLHKFSMQAPDKKHNLFKHLDGKCAECKANRFCYNAFENKACPIVSELEADY